MKNPHHKSYRESAARRANLARYRKHHYRTDRQIVNAIRAVFGYKPIGNVKEEGGDADAGQQSTYPVAAARTVHPQAAGQEPRGGLRAVISRAIERGLEHKRKKTVITS